MISNATPPPRLPHPAVVALAVPTTFESNIVVVQSDVRTKDPLAKEMRARKTSRAAKLSIVAARKPGALRIHQKSRIRSADSVFVSEGSH